ncbi:hypothetical protein FDECE_14929 [Fusarium decemcellulare]|nr:hypothetical protein FDECE_14929 [Fusarium decemcellulare]
MASQADIFGAASDLYNSTGVPCQSGTPLSSSSSGSATTNDWETVSESVRSHWVLSTRTSLATRWFWNHGYDVQARASNRQHGSPIWLCCHCVRRKVHKPKAYISSNTRNIEGHLAKAHGILNPDPSKAKRYATERPSDQLSLHEFSAKKRKKDDFHDELVLRFDKTEFQRLLVQWITDANLSFRVPEHEGLQKVFQYLNPLVQETSAVLTHETVRTRIIHEFNGYKMHVIDAMLRSPSQVHIAFDGWTSRNRNSFFSINAFFLDEETFRPRKIVLGLPNVTIAHTGENISAAVTEVLNEFELVANNKIGCFVLDNASSNDSAVEELGATLRWEDPRCRRIRCFGHILHLVAKAILFVKDEDSLEDLNPDDFNKLQEEDSDKSYPGALDVVLDNSTRWLSQYYMIERAIKLQRYLKELIDITIGSSKKFPRSRQQLAEPPSLLLPCLKEANLLSDADWDALGWFKDILSKFESCLLRLEGDGQTWLRKRGIKAQYGSIWQVAVAYKFLLTTLKKAKVKALDRPEPSYYASCVNSAWVKLNKYYSKLDETPTYYAAMVLYPGI